MVADVQTKILNYDGKPAATGYNHGTQRWGGYGLKALVKNVLQQIPVRILWRRHALIDVCIYGKSQYLQAVKNPVASTAVQPPASNAESAEKTHHCQLCENHNEAMGHRSSHILESFRKSNHHSKQIHHIVKQ